MPLTRSPSTREHRQSTHGQEAGHGAQARIHARRNVVAYLALVAALGAAGGVAYSSIPDAQGVIHAATTTPPARSA